MQPFSLRCFGVGDGTASPTRNHSSFLYTFGDVSLLLDCGEPISRSFIAAGLSCELIDRIFISHLHADHIGGFLMLVQGFWLDKRQKELQVHLPGESIEPLRRMMQASFLFEELLPFAVTFVPLSSGEAVAIGGVRVTPFPSSHLHGLRKRFESKYPGNYEAFCFLLESDGRRIGHSADLGSPRDLDPLVAQPLDLLVCELAHFKREELFEYLRGRPIRSVAFIHVARYFWARIDETRALAAQLLPETSFFFPQDLEVINLTPP